MAVAAATGATLLRIGLDPLWGSNYPFIVFYPAVALSAWMGGFWPGIVTTLLSAAAAEYFWVASTWSFALEDKSDITALLVFAVVGAIISGFFEALHRAAAAAARAERERSSLLEAERAARASAETAGQQLRLALEAGRLGTWEWTIATGRVEWSPGLLAIHGLAPGSFPGTLDAVQREIHAEDRQRVLKSIEEAIEQRRDYFVEYRMVRPDGALRWLEGRGRISCDADGRPERMVGVCSDITDRKQAEDERARLLERERASRAEVERASLLKDEFLAVLSHELRTPLNAILSWTQLLGSGTLSAQRTSHAVKVIERSAQAEAHLVESLLDLSRIMAGRLELRSGPLDLAAVVTAAAEALRPMAEAGGRSLEVAVPASPVVSSGDAARLRQIVWNLVSNALKFTPSGGRVRVQVSREDSEARIAVSDDGQGIAADFLPQLFGRFTQADTRTSRTQHGLGLGLAIVRELARAHGGSVAAHSPGIGRGSVFTVTLPIREPASPPAPELDDTAWAVASASLQQLRVLLVEDQADAREALCLALESEGAVVRTAASASEGLAAMSMSRPDLLIADIGMPREDGYDLIRRIRTLERERSQSRLPALALTAYASMSDREQALAAGFDLHLAKPAAPAELLQALAKLNPRRHA